MDPRWLFPLLSLGFALAAAVHGLRHRRWQGAARTWAWLAVVFGVVGWWLRRG